MPRPATVTTWPDAGSLHTWLGPDAVSAVTDATLFDLLIAEAFGTIMAGIDPDKLPAAEDECPPPLHRAIVLEAARLLFRRQSPHGVAVFAEAVARLRADGDVGALTEPYLIGPEP